MDCLVWKRKQEDNKELLSLMSAGGGPGGDFKALGADLNWVLYWGRERDGMEECRRGDRKVRRRLWALSVIRL